jgi:hypothetical protein
VSTRREFVLASLALWDAATVTAQMHPHTATVEGLGLHNYTFLTPDMRETLRRAMAIMIPADERSGGALAAKVDEYVDFILANADGKLQQTWRAGLARLGEAKDMDAFLSLQARNEFSPETEDESFFILLKQAITAGFYTSAEGINRELGYQGMTFALDFEGCTHTEHIGKRDA